MKKVLVGIIMGSDSDLPVMSRAAAVLDELKVPYELTVVSAHRTPDRMYKYAQSAVRRGLKVIVAGAGGAAHLPGMVAALTTLPVIGVPVKSKTMSGTDSLFSIVQMPPGVPVATVAINGGINAGILAAEVIGTNNKRIQRALSTYKKRMNKDVVKKATKLERIKYKAYLDESIKNS